MLQGRSLPVITIADKCFEVDVLFEEFREKGNPVNTIPFAEIDWHPQGGYVFWYDRKRNQAADLYAADKDIIKVRTLEMVQLDAEGMAFKYGLQTQDLPERDADCRTGVEILQRRLYGKAPTISICNKVYWIDKSGLLPTELEGAAIVPPHWKNSEHLSKFSFYYDRERHQLVTLSPDIREEPKNVVLVSIVNPLPSIYRLQSLRKRLKDDPSLIQRSRIQVNFEARIFPLSESILPDIIRENRQMELSAAGGKKGVVSLPYKKQKGIH